MKEEIRPELFEQAGPDEVAGRAAPSRPAWILVVDDEAPARILAARVFSEAGFEVVAADSGFKCLELFRKQPYWFDLVLLDFSMPFMDGAETFRRLRAIHPGVVVLLSTGFMAQVENRIERMLATGLDGIILKPHRPDELVAKVQAILQRVKMARVGCVAGEMAASA
ncbi:MAG TPA: response regulator [Chthoniobacterales bacterium]|jgi:DNA-binding response OmpR family regulator|nr:response regulator [Chthoniobacterales bacterium]